MPIVLQNLTYIYSPGTPFERKALDDITFTIDDGDFFGIIGHTGSGKSTLISHFNGLTKLMSGKLTVDEFDLSKKYDYKSLRSRVGMVFQYPEYQLFDETVKKDVGFGPRNLGLADDEIEFRVKEAIELVGLNYYEIAERSPFELSGGQMRRVALAGVLAMKPKILVLDEPTAGLDPRGKREILSLIRSIKKECPTIIMISHNMDEIAENCNKIAVLSEGKLKGVFRPDELFRQTELIKSLNMELPTVTYLATQLNARGYDIDKGITDVDVLVKEIARIKGVE
ncbi:MAG: energy-coupling factor transporter ATPase [Clostridia bacterium]|nr:energy-coupling factor transporter ATPase [Clostridia bacterium]